MTSFLFGPFLIWAPVVALWIIALIVLSKNINIFEHVLKILPTYRTLIRITIGIHITYALFLTAAQYYVWSLDPSRVFLFSPLGSTTPIPFVQQLPWLFDQPLGYFILYIGVRFWLPALLSIFIPLLFGYFLRLLEKYKERFFEEGDRELGLLAALIVGWPAVVVFVPLMFVSVVLVSIARMIILKELYTTLRWPFVVALFLTLIFGSMFLSMFGLDVLKIN